MLTRKVKRIIQAEKSEVVEKPITVPDDWAMFTPAGNRRITTLARRLYDAIDNPELTKGQKVDALFRFHREWCKMDSHKTYGEAGDTAVRECVGAFHDEMAEAIGFDGPNLWEQFWNDKASKGC